MLLQFSVSNFRAFRGLQTLNLAASNYDKDLPENTVTPDFPGLKGKRWLKGVALYGANASGKSTLIEAMRALSNWVRTSAKTTDPEDAIECVDPFALNPSAPPEPTAFAIVFVAGGTRFEYRVAATRNLVVHESLRAWPVGKEQVWFERDWNAEKREHMFSPENPTGMARNRTVEDRTLRNMLYLSKAVAEAREEVEPAFQWLVRGLRFLDLSNRSSLEGGFTLSRIDSGDAGMKEKILNALRHADLGIVDARSIDSAPPGLGRDWLRALSGTSMAVAKDWGLNPRFLVPELFHKGPENKPVALPWERESSGTHRIFALIGPFLDFLKNGNTVCIDEIETSMHPLMVRELLKLFFSKEENRAGAQIIFTTHNPLLLDGTLMRRDQVWFTDKDEEGAAHLYPLSDYQPRQGESLIRGYMAGRYGAVPFVPDGLLGTFPAIEEAVAGKETAHD
ncbi:MAG: ATP-binding protein [Opitutales bacterium]|nr:ATP-binding protein [Opitutales bacterium]